MKEMVFLVGSAILLLTLTGGMWIYLEYPFERRRKRGRSIALPRYGTTENVGLTQNVAPVEVAKHSEQRAA